MMQIFQVLVSDSWIVAQSISIPARASYISTSLHTQPYLMCALFTESTCITLTLYTCLQFLIVGLGQTLGQIIKNDIFTLLDYQVLHNSICVYDVHFPPCHL